VTFDLVQAKVLVELKSKNVSAFIPSGHEGCCGSRLQPMKSSSGTRLDRFMTYFHLLWTVYDKKESARERCIFHGRAIWSGCSDSNRGPLGPKPSALPDCATPRTRAVFNLDRDQTHNISEYVINKTSFLLLWSAVCHAV
jgi:hypothetical protein